MFYHIDYFIFFHKTCNTSPFLLSSLKRSISVYTYIQETSRIMQIWRQQNSQSRKWTILKLATAAAGRLNSRERPLKGCRRMKVRRALPQIKRCCGSR